MPDTPASGSSPQPPARSAAPQTIPGFENMSFAEQRQAQDQLAAAARAAKQQKG